MGYLEGALPEEVRMRLEHHLAGCEACTNYMYQMRTTIRLLGNVPEENLTSQPRDDLLWYS